MNEKNPGTGLLVLDPIKQEVRDHWNRASEGYNRGGYGPSEVRELWLSEFREIAGAGRKKVLDVGTGTGFVASAFAELGHDVTGVDLSPRMLAHARQNFEARHLAIPLREGDAEKLPFDDHTFDLVVSRHVLWTLPHPEKAIEEWIRVVKPGGTIAIVAGPHSDRRKATDLLRRIYLAWRTKKLSPLTHAYSKRLYRNIPYASKGVTEEELRALLSEFPVTGVQLKGLEHITELSRKLDPAQRQAWWCVKRIYYPGFIASFRVAEEPKAWEPNPDPFQRGPR